MKRRVYTWLIVVAGAIGLPLLAMCALQRSGALEHVLHGAAELADGAVARARALVAVPDGPDGAGEPAMSQASLMSCADPEPVSASPLWCEDHGDGARCVPAAPDRPAHDLGAPSPALASAALRVPVAPRSFVVPAPRTAHAGLGVSRGACAGVERPPRA